MNKLKKNPKSCILGETWKQTNKNSKLCLSATKISEINKTYISHYKQCSESDCERA